MLTESLATVMVSVPAAKGGHTLPTGQSVTVVLGRGTQPGSPVWELPKGPRDHASPHIHLLSGTDMQTGQEVDRYPEKSSEERSVEFFPRTSRVLTGSIPSYSCSYVSLFTQEMHVNCCCSKELP